MRVRYDRTELIASICAALIKPSVSSYLPLVKYRHTITS
jgi:hypothetical protein